MIKTKKTFDVASYSDKDAEMRKLVFDKIRIVQDFELGQTTIHFIESKVIAENVEEQVEVIDDEGNPVFDGEGNPTFETKIRDKTKRLRNLSKTVPFDVYNEIANQVKQKLPEGIDETEEDRYIAEQGIKIYIAQEGLYKGKLTLEDFE